MLVALACVSSLGLAGCQSTAEFLAQTQPKAIDAAQKRGAFELNCPTATAQLISQQDVAPEIQTVRFSAPDRGVFTVGVSGCGQRATYVVVCPNDGSGNCFAGDGRR
jgi:hypothetical protein